MSRKPKSRNIVTTSSRMKSLSSTTSTRTVATSGSIVTPIVMAGSHTEPHHRLLNAPERRLDLRLRGGGGVPRVYLRCRFEIGQQRSQFVGARRERGAF